MFISPVNWKPVEKINGFVIALDIGATKIVSEALPVKDGKVVPVIMLSKRIERYTSFDGGIKEAISHARENNLTPLVAAGVFPPGPINEKDQTIFITNRRELGNDGIVHLGDLANEVNLPILFGNDVGNGWAGFVQWGPRENDLHSLRTGEKRSNNFALLAPGGGLGGCVMQDGKPASAEPGHVPFNHAHQPDLRKLDKWLGDESRFEGQPCFEDVACGPGLLNLLDYVYNKLYGQEIPERFKTLRAEDSNEAIAQIAKEARDGSNAGCVRAMELYVQCLGSLAGIMACIGPATGGFFLGGASARNDFPFFKEHKDDFVKPFEAQRKLRRDGINIFTSSIPLRVIVNQYAPTIGAAHSVVLELQRQIRQK